MYSNNNSICNILQVNNFIGKIQHASFAGAKNCDDEKKPECWASGSEKEKLRIAIFSKPRKNLFRLYEKIFDSARTGGQKEKGSGEMNFCPPVRNSVSAFLR